MMNDEPDPRWSWSREFNADMDVRRSHDQIEKQIDALRAWDPALLESPGGRHLNDLLCLAAGLLRKLGSAGRTFEKGSATDVQELDRFLTEGISRIHSKWCVARSACAVIQRARAKQQEILAYATTQLERFDVDPSLANETRSRLDAFRMQRRAFELDFTLREKLGEIGGLDVFSLDLFRSEVEALDEPATEARAVFDSRVPVPLTRWENCRWWVRRLLRR